MKTIEKISGVELFISVHQKEILAALYSLILGRV